MAYEQKMAQRANAESRSVPGPTSPSQAHCIGPTLAEAESPAPTPLPVDGGRLDRPV